jgi:hypothetical protein
MTILEEARHTLIIIEHDPLLYEHVTEMTEYSLIKFSAGSSEPGFGSTPHSWSLDGQRDSRRDLSSPTWLVEKVIHNRM